MCYIQVKNGKEYNKVLDELFKPLEINLMCLL